MGDEIINNVKLGVFYSGNYLTFDVCVNAWYV